jgi:hypothetical protein
LVVACNFGHQKGIGNEITKDSRTCLINGWVQKWCPKCSFVGVKILTDWKGLVLRTNELNYRGERTINVHIVGQSFRMLCFWGLLRKFPN